MDVLADQMPFVAPEKALEQRSPPVCPDTVRSSAERAMPEKFGTTLCAEGFDREPARRPDGRVRRDVGGRSANVGLLL